MTKENLHWHLSLLVFHPRNIQGGTYRRKFLLAFTVLFKKIYENFKVAINQEGLFVSLPPIAF